MWFLSGGFRYEVFYSDETRSIAGLEKKATNQKNLGCGLYDLQGRVEGGSSDESCLSQTVDPEVDRHESGGGRPMRRGSLHITICVGLSYFWGRHAVLS